MTCIYCKAPSAESRGVAHVLPEAIIKNGVSLPLGTVCDRCNNYIGATLDTAILEHPILALAIQLLGLPGKRGKPRKLLGGVQRDQGGRYIEIPADRAEEITLPDGTREALVTVGPSPNFDDPRFGRALHQLAFAAGTLAEGSGWALDSRFDPVRNYIRKPKIGEHWPYGVYGERLDPVRRLLDIRRVPKAPGETVILRLFQLDFYVDLLNSGALEDWFRRHLPPSAKFGQAIAAGRRTEYFLRIYLDGSQPGDSE